MNVENKPVVGCIEGDVVADDDVAIAVLVVVVGGDCVVGDVCIS